MDRMAVLPASEQPASITASPRWVDLRLARITDTGGSSTPDRMKAGLRRTDDENNSEDQSRSDLELRSKCKGWREHLWGRCTIHRCDQQASVWRSKLEEGI